MCAQNGFRTPRHGMIITFSCESIMPDTVLNLSIKSVLIAVGVKWEIAFFYVSLPRFDGVQ